MGREKMNNRYVYYVFVILLIIYFAFTIYMYFSKDANFTIYYNLSSLITILLLVALTLIGVFTNERLRFFLVLFAILGMHMGIKNFVFSGDIAKFLYNSNRRLYDSCTNMIINKKLDGYVRLSGSYNKLSRSNFTQVIREGDYIEIHYGIFSSFSFPERIVYVSDKNMFLKKEGKYFYKYKVLNKEWYLVYYGRD